MMTADPAMAALVKWTAAAAGNESNVRFPRDARHFWRRWHHPGTAGFGGIAFLLAPASSAPPSAWTKTSAKRLLQVAKIPVVLGSPSIATTGKQSGRNSRRRRTEISLPRFRETRHARLFRRHDQSPLARGIGACAESSLRVRHEILIEESVTAREIEVSVLGNHNPQASVPGEIVPHREFYDYTAKYLEEGTQLLIPAELKPAQVQRIQKHAVDAFRALELSGMARVDFFLEKEGGKIYLNEVNTIPGFTSISMYPKLWEASGIPFRELIDKLIALALEQHAEKPAPNTRSSSRRLLRRPRRLILYSAGLQLPSIHTLASGCSSQR